MSHNELSGIVVAQNQKPQVGDKLAIADNTWRYQEFFLPDDYRRGADASEVRYPNLTGFQLLVEILADHADRAGLDWKLETKAFGLPWETLTSGTTVRSHADGTVWFDVYFPKEIAVTEATAEQRYRIGIKAPIGSIDRDHEIVEYHDSTLIVDNDVYTDVILPPHEYVPIIHLGIPSFVHYDPDRNEAHFSTQRGISHVWYSAPNPLALLGNAKALAADGTTPLVDGSDQYSFCFRVLGSTADEGVDFLGNRFRSAVVASESNNTSTATGAVKDKIWLSAPQPSRFAAVSQYFDVSVDGQPQVVDTVLLDPATPGMYFHIYYSNEGDPGKTLYTWENKLWTPVPRTFHAVKRDNFVLPEPISAKYVKIEYSHLQARPYSPGNFEQPIRYKKHPKWVLDYFMARTADDRASRTEFVADRVGVVYNALDLAYNYYLDDIRQAPDQPIAAPNASLRNLQRFLGDRTDASDQVDAETLSRIRYSLKPYLDQPALLSKPFDYLLAGQAFSEALNDADYPVERASSTATNNLNLRDIAVVYENTMPVMFFYLACRHRYREATTNFAHDHAYFAGVREIAFTREHYTVAADTSLYIEAGADFVNTERNDFVADDRGLVVVDA